MFHLRLVVAATVILTSPSASAFPLCTCLYHVLLIHSSLIFLHPFCFYHLPSYSNLQTPLFTLTHPFCIFILHPTSYVLSYSSTVHHHSYIPSCLSFLPYLFSSFFLPFPSPWWWRSIQCIKISLVFQGTTVFCTLPCISCSCSMRGPVPAEPIPFPS